ncbi:MAG: hypothetical protein KF773_22610 [Deltaproteobacteria bacterium]|nr:hypothetical protein [Deltaproteobacteria bacterium]
MRLLAGGVLAWFVAVAGCHDALEHYPVNPGGGPPGTGGPGVPDAPGVGLDGAPGTITGRVCLLVDLRRLSTCAVQAPGITVTLGTSVAITAADGTFTIQVPLGSTLVWRVGGANLTTSVIPFSAAAPLLPVIRDADYLDLLTSNGVLLSDLQGSVVARLVRNGAPLPGAAVAVAPTTPFPVFYDGNSALVWNQNATGPAGLAWIPGADATQPLTLAITPALEPPTSAVQVRVENQAITFVVIDVP